MIVLTYEISEFIAKIRGTGEKSYKLTPEESISITGIVGGPGSHDPVMLQSVRLSMVMKMADCICESITLVERFWENTAII